MLLCSALLVFLPAVEIEVVTPPVVHGDFQMEVRLILDQLLQLTHLEGVEVQVQLSFIVKKVPLGLLDYSHVLYQMSKA